MSSSVPERELQLQPRLCGKASLAEAGVPAVVEEHRPGNEPVGYTEHDPKKTVSGPSSKAETSRRQSAGARSFYR